MNSQQATLKKSARQKFAERKKLDENFLTAHGLHNRGDSLVFRYPARAGMTPLRSRVRNSGIDKGFSWKISDREGERPIGLYGEHRLAFNKTAGYLLLVEGESDSLTAWSHGYPALGVPGVSHFTKLQTFHLDGIKTLYVAREPGPAGQNFNVNVERRARALGFKGSIKSFEACGKKDISDLHCDDPAQFSKRLRSALAQAVEVLPSVEAKPVRPKTACGCQSHTIHPDELKRAIDSIDLDAHITRQQGEPDRSGRWCCPFHPDNNPSLSTKEGKDGRKRFRCWSCGAEGDVVEWQERLLKVDFLPALESLGIKIKKSAKTPVSKKPVRLNTNEKDPSVNSDKTPASPLERLGNFNCPTPIAGYFTGKGKNEGSGLAGVHRCGNRDCHACDAAWRRDRLFHFCFQNPDTKDVPILIEHHATFGGSFHTALIDTKSDPKALERLTKSINRAGAKDGVKKDSVQYLAIKGDQVFLLATVPFSGSAESTLEQACVEVQERIINVERKIKRARPITASKGWNRPKESKWELASRPTHEQLTEIQDDINQMAKRGEVENVSTFKIDRNRMMKWKFKDETVQREFHARHGIIPKSLHDTLQWPEGAAAKAIQQCESCTWVKSEDQHGTKTECEKCGRFYGYDDKRKPTEK